MYKLLIIEDEPIMAKVLKRMFTSEKYEVTNTNTAGEGFEACLKELPDLVLMDVHLPDGNGLDLCRKMKETPRIKHIPIIIMTGEATSVDCKMMGLESGAEDYVLKPFISEELIARVAGILKRSFNMRD
ncbi:MAG: response regulator transcription factor [Elusimicrobiota bacterium]|nr:response regulator transcription factor [Elusimicrobiota bacterium]